MPALLGKHEFLDEKPLRFKLDLLRAENPSNWEGWLEYKAELYNGDELVVGLGEGPTIIDSDIDQLCEFLTNDATDYFEPMEPDFRLVKILNQFPDKDKVGLFIALDEGIRRKKGYAGNGIGISILVDDGDLEEFTAALKGQYHELTKNLSKTSH